MNKKRNSAKFNQKEHISTLKFQSVNGPMVDLLLYKKGRVNKQFLEDIYYSEDFIHLGYAPKPKTKLEVFTHDFYHGMIMRYRFLSVLEYSVRSAFDYWDGWTSRQ